MPCLSEQKSTPAMRRLRRREGHGSTSEKKSPEGESPLGFRLFGDTTLVSSKSGELEKRRNQMKTFESSFMPALYGGVNNEYR